MGDIDRLQSNVYNLRRQRASGNPASDEARQLQESLTGLEVHYTTYSKQLQGAPDGVPVPREHLDFLQSYAWNALQDARSVASSMELETLPLHTDILTPGERESFANDLAIVNSLLQGKEGQLTPEDVQTLVEAASRLGEHNSRCKNALNTLSHPKHNNDPVHLQSMYGSIDRFQRALEHAVEKAIGTEPPAPPIAEPETVPAPETMTTREKLDQSLGEMSKYLALSKDRPLSRDELNIVGEHYDNVQYLTQSYPVTYITERLKAGSIFEEIKSHERDTTPRIETAAREITFPTPESDVNDDLYSATPRLERTSNSDGSETFHTLEERVNQLKERLRDLQLRTNIISDEGSHREHSVAKSMPYDAGKQKDWESESTVSSLTEDEDDDTTSLSDISIYTDANDGTDKDDDDKRASR